MPEEKLLIELAETLSKSKHKEYVKSYAIDKEKGIDAKFDEFVKADIDET